MKKEITEKKQRKGKEPTKAALKKELDKAVEEKQQQNPTLIKYVVCGRDQNDVLYTRVEGHWNKGEFEDFASLLGERAVNQFNYQLSSMLQKQEKPEKVEQPETNEKAE